MVEGQFCYKVNTTAVPSLRQAGRTLNPCSDCSSVLAWSGWVSWRGKRKTDSHSKVFQNNAREFCAVDILCNSVLLIHCIAQRFLLSTRPPSVEGEVTTLASVQSANALFQSRKAPDQYLKISGLQKHLLLVWYFHRFSGRICLFCYSKHCLLDQQDDSEHTVLAFPEKDQQATWVWSSGPSYKWRGQTSLKEKKSPPHCRKHKTLACCRDIRLTIAKGFWRNFTDEAKKLDSWSWGQRH